MQLNELNFTGPQPIDGYGPGFFRVAGQVHDGPVLIHAGGIRRWSGGFADTAPVLELLQATDVLLFGWGQEPVALPTEFRNVIEATGAGIEPMATASACRTYNVLLAEGRRVVAALRPIDQG